MRASCLALLAALLSASAICSAEEPQPDIVRTGTITAADAQHYLQVAFDVPAGVERITVTLVYARSNKTVIDMGVWGPDGFRGWSGGTRDRFTIARSDATPGYYPGPLTPGRWQVILGVPNARADAHDPYTVRIFFDIADAQHATDAIVPAAIKRDPAWFRGDLHMHGAHSDGSCLNPSGQRVPCPLFRTVEAAAEQGLDFIALSDHNTLSQLDDERELQPYFDRLLLIPATEMTTFHGHANAFGLRRFVDFRVGTPSVPDVRSLERSVAAAGAILSINHPDSPTGEICMGCGWTWPDTDYAGIAAVEAINGNTVSGPLAGLGFWYARLNEGHRLTGIGGSDNHDVGSSRGAPVGRPTTVVHANELSLPAILAGIRAGNVFIDVAGTRDRLLEVSGRAGRRAAVMGGILPVQRDWTLDVHVVAASGGTIVPVVNGQALHDKAVAVTGSDQRTTIPFHRQCGWVSVNVEHASSRPLLIGNPIYLRCTR